MVHRLVLIVLWLEIVVESRFLFILFLLILFWEATVCKLYTQTLTAKRILVQTSSKQFHSIWKVSSDSLPGIFYRNSNLMLFNEKPPVAITSGLPFFGDFLERRNISPKTDDRYSSGKSVSNRFRVERDGTSKTLLSPRNLNPLALFSLMELGTVESVTGRIFKTNLYVYVG